MNFRTVAPVIALVIAGACTRIETGAWVRPGAEEADVKRDTAMCRARAQEYVDRELATQPSDQDFIRPEDARTVEGAFTQLDSGRVFRRVFDNCMRGEGYIRQKD